MNTGGLIIIVGAMLSLAAAILWWANHTRKMSRAKTTVSPPQPSGVDIAKLSAANIFDDEFREELRNRGRLHFEKVIGESAMFLQQDLRQTTTQLNDYMRAELTRTLQEEFKKYEQSISDAKQLALGSIEKTITTIDQQRQFLLAQLQTQSEEQKAHIIASFEKSMASVVNHYVLRAIGDQIDLSDQLDYILAQLDANKAAIIEDIKRGA